MYFFSHRTIGQDSSKNRGSSKTSLCRGSSSASPIARSIERYAPDAHARVESGDGTVRRRVLACQPSISALFATATGTTLSSTATRTTLSTTTTLPAATAASATASAISTTAPASINLAKLESVTEYVDICADTGTRAWETTHRPGLYPLACDGPGGRPGTMESTTIRDLHQG